MHYAPFLQNAAHLLVQTFQFPALYSWSGRSSNVKSKPLINHLPNDKILDVIKLKTFADNKSNVVKMAIFLFIQCLQKTSYSGLLKSHDCVVKSYVV